MRHKVAVKKLGRTHSHRKALMQNLAIMLIKHRSIQTTLSKAKELRRFIEPLITRAKVDSLHNRRILASRLNHKLSVKKIFELGEEFKDRPGGYTRVLKLVTTRGDAADTAIIELVTSFDVAPAKETKKAKKTKAKAGKAETPAIEDSQVETEINQASDIEEASEPAKQSEDKEKSE